jgi:hypothetical protein
LLPFGPRGSRATIPRCPPSTPVLLRVA